jgi:glycerophosphoryl diester phosphodiesterase
MRRIIVAGICYLLLFNESSMVSASGGSHAELVGFASLPADTFADGPAAGAGISANGRTGPFPGQPVQGFGGVQFAPGASGAFWFLSDNGFGSKANSADYLLRIYQLRPDFRTISGGTGTVAVEAFITLSDPNRLAPFPIVNPQSRLLTGADFDIESMVIDDTGDLWIGEEFGPFVLRFDASGRLLAAPIPTPDLEADRRLSETRQVQSPDHPAPSGAPTLPRSRGFEGMAFSPDRRVLYPMLEGPVTGDPAGALRIYELQREQGAFKRLVGFYQLEDPSHAIGDFTPVNDGEFLVIERDGGQGASARFKKIFQVNLSNPNENGFLPNKEVVDLLNIADSNDLNRDGRRIFDLPFVTIENILVIDPSTILVANDNNYPFSVGRGPEIDNNEIILLRLHHPLRLDPRLGKQNRS